MRRDRTERDERSKDESSESSDPWTIFIYHLVHILRSFSTSKTMTVTIPPSHEAFGRERKNKRPKDNGQDKGTRKGRQNKEWAASLVTTQTEHKERKRHKLQQEKNSNGKRK